MATFTDNLLQTIAAIADSSIKMDPVTLQPVFGKLNNNLILEMYYVDEAERKEDTTEYVPEYNDDELKSLVSGLTWDTPIWCDINKLIFRNKYTKSGESLIYTLKRADRAITIKDFVCGVWRVKINKLSDEVPPAIKRASYTEDVIDGELVKCITYDVNYEAIYD